MAGDAAELRFDLASEEDLIEEIARVHGYANIPERIERASLLPKPEPEDRVALSRVRSALVDRGYFEAITYSFGEPAMQALFAPDEQPQRLVNPISSELAVMRVSLWPGLLGAVRRMRAASEPGATVRNREVSRQSC